MLNLKNTFRTVRNILVSFNTKTLKEEIVLRDESKPLQEGGVVYNIDGDFVVIFSSIEEEFLYYKIYHSFAKKGFHLSMYSLDNILRYLKGYYRDNVYISDLIVELEKEYLSREDWGNTP